MNSRTLFFQVRRTAKLCCKVRPNKVWQQSMPLLLCSFLASSKVKMQFVPASHGKKYPNPTTQYNLLLMKVRSIKKTSTRVRCTKRFQISRCMVCLTLQYSSEIQNEFEVQPFNGKYAVLVPCSRGLMKSDDSHDRGGGLGNKTITTFVSLNVYSAVSKMV